MLPESQIRQELQSQPPPPRRSRLARLGILSLSSLTLFLFSFLVSPIVRIRVNALDATATGIATSTQPVKTPGTPTGTAIQPLPAQPTRTISPAEGRGSPAEPDRGTIFLSIDEGGYSHLFAYDPLELPLTRLTAGPWDDLTPTLSPDGTQLAFASDRSGFWDLYLLTLATGEVTRLTDTPQYDSAPDWSPDGQYLVHETYSEDLAGSGSGPNLEIAILPLSEGQPTINLSEHPAADFEPAWSPLGRQIAFVSTRTGEREIWLADLDKAGDERFTNLSSSQTAAESHPAWSPDGTSLAWSASEDGKQNLYIWKKDGEMRYVGSGDWPAWSPGNETLLTTLPEPNRSFVTGYSVSGGLLALPPVALPGPASGLSWPANAIPEELPPPLAEAAILTPGAAWNPKLGTLSDVPNGRHHLVDLEDVSAPYPQLHDLVDEAFMALRERVAQETGWDFLYTLENAFVPLTSPLSPGMGEDWLYTGRAFAFSPLPINSGWAVVVPEQFGDQTFWRVYLKARYQDGSQGAPLRDRAWDFNARFTGDPLTYEQGGRLTESIPTGYWVDFTALANMFGWERLPALSIWRSAYFAARFNEFVLPDGNNWREAMMELYPPDALLTPTIAPPPTLTPTPTPWWKRSP